MTAALASEAARLEAEGHALVAEGHAKLAHAARLRSEVADANSLEAVAADELVPLDRAPVEAKSLRQLERDGALLVRKIGRRKYTTRMALAALVSAAPASSSPPREPTTDPAVDPREAARRAYAGLTTRDSGQR